MESSFNRAWKTSWVGTGLTSSGECPRRWVKFNTPREKRKDGNIFKFRGQSLKKLCCRILGKRKTTNSSKQESLWSWRNLSFGFVTWKKLEGERKSTSHKMISSSDLHTPPAPTHAHLASLVPIGKRFSAQICLLCIQDSREYRFLLVSFWYLQNYLTNRTALRTFPGKSTYLDDTEARLCSQLVISHTSI